MCPTALGRKEKKLSNVHIVQCTKARVWVGGRALRLPQVLIKPRKTTGVHWWQREGGLLSLVNTCGEIGLCPPCMEARPP